MKLNISAQAALMMRQSKNFNMDDFLSFLVKKGFPIGSSNVMEYLQVRDCREFGDPKSQEVVIDGSKL